MYLWIQIGLWIDFHDTTKNTIDDPLEHQIYGPIYDLIEVEPYMFGK